MNILQDRLRSHLGHHIEIAMYGEENLSLECVDCCEVIVDSDVYDICPANEGD